MSGELAVLREILAELRALREALEARQQPRSLRHQDRRALRRILPVLRATFAGTFSTWEVIDGAQANDARAQNLALVIGKRTAQELGQLFARAADHDIDGTRLRRAGQDAHGARWECDGNSFP